MDEQQAQPTQPPTGSTNRSTATGRSRSRRVLGGLALTGALAAGGLTVAAVNPLGIAGAQDGPGTTSVQRAAGTPSDAAAGHGRFAAHGSKVLDDSLAALVKDGTLTQAQADAVKAKVAETAKSMRSEREAQRDERRQAMESTAATALGMSVADLQAQLQSGKTLAQIAQAKGVEVQKVIDALVAEANTRIDQAASAGKLDASKVPTLKQEAAQRITSMVNDGPRRPGSRR